jgi:hypothetical protein
MCFEKNCENVMEAKSDEKNENDQKLFFLIIKLSEFFSKSSMELLLLLNTLSQPFFIDKHILLIKMNNINTIKTLNNNSSNK